MSEGTILTLVIIGIAVIVVFAFLLWLSRLYVKAPSNRAFVRVGGFGGGSEPKVIMNGGALVIGLIHEITWVDLGTMAVEIERTEQNALLTNDPQYADIRAIFYIKVEPTIEGVTTAARTIGGQKVDKEVVKDLIDAKLDGALRDVAATFKLMSLHQEREKFIEEVQKRVKDDLQENGLVLESVSILTLRAAEQGSFPTNDVFGAQVARTNAALIEEARREQNETERRNELRIKQEDITTDQKKLKMEQELAFATATQQREVLSRQAAEKEATEKEIYELQQSTEQARIILEQSTKQKRIAEEEATEQTLIAQEQATLQTRIAQEQATQQKRIAEEQTTEQTRIAQEQATLQTRIAQEQITQEKELVKARRIKLAEIENQQTILVQEERKQQEQETAEIVRQQTIEVAQQAKKIAVLEQERAREAAERELLLIAAEREEAEQAVVTVEETKRAEREAKIQIIQAQRDADRAKIERQTVVDIDAYKQIKEAEAQALALTEIAQAEFDAAQKQAETKRTQAKAESDAAKALADGERARSSAAGLAEAEVIKAKAEAMQLEAEVIRAKGLAEAEAVKAKGLAEAEAEKAKAEALAAFDGVSQKLELEKLRLQAEIQIEVARAQAMGAAISNMQIKMFGTPDAADNILRLMSFTEGMNDVIEAAPAPVREVGSQLVSKLLGGNGKNHAKSAPATNGTATNSTNDSNDSDGEIPTLEENTALLSQLTDLVDRTLDINSLDDLTVQEVLNELEAHATTNQDKQLITQARNAQLLIPFLANANFQDIYLRYRVATTS